MTNGKKFKDVFGFGADGSRVIAVNATWWDCEYQSHKHSNADRIRSMTDEELAEWFGKIQYNTAFYCDGEDKQKYPYPVSWLDWLKQEVEEGE